MALEIRHSDSEDPFGDLSSLSFFPQTLAASTASNTGSETQGPDSVEKIFKSMVLKGSAKLLEQALAISKSSSNTENLFLEAEDKAVVANGRDNMDRPLGRRPALGRRRAQFNLKTVQSDSKADSGIYDIVEPHEYFSAVDQMQKAEEELKKCRDGAATDLAQIQQYATVRSRRMGLLGRTATYKHHLSANADTTETFVASQEVTPGRRITSPAKIPTDGESSSLLHREPTEKGSPLATRANNELPNVTKEEGSKAQKEKSVEDLLDKLFSTFKDLNGGNGIALLQERLQIKSTDVSKMILPELDSTQRDNLRVPKNTLTRKRLDGSQLPPTMSPNTTKNPLAVIANLQRRISLRDHLPDPYSMPPTDDAPLSPADIDCGVTDSRTSVGISTPVIVSGKRLNSVEKLHLPVHEPVETLGSKKTSEDVINHVPSLEKEGDDMQLNPSVCAQPDPVVKDLTSSFVNQNDMDVFASQSKRNMDGNSSSRINVSSGSFGSDISLQGEVSVVLEGEPVPYSEVSKESTGGPSTRRIGQKTTSSGIDAAGSLGQDAILQDEVNVVVQGEPPSYAEVSRDNRSIPGVLLEEDVTSENLHNLAEEHNEILRFQEASEVSPKIGRKRKAPPNGQSKEKPTSRKQPISKRQSLADAGMIWKSGVRRSTRIKSRPLQYWCGERFLLGRIHDSLATVIGVKYACPGDDGKSPVLKVKSFVSEEYADLVSQVAV